ncbi:MAG TPA: class I SAM-dependent methyltransferase [Ignavibacteriaceae bacterium]|nr:class I SAM-dependent methyltransferase [Ignavibacteriaceae bacterium]
MESAQGKNRQHFDKSYGGNPAENYQKYFVPVIGKPIAADLISVANIKPGEKIIDIACGTGVAAFLAKEKTGKDGMVAGVDVNPGMLGVARSITPENISIDWYESPADNIPLDDNTFDVALSSLSLQFFPDKPAALKEIYRVLKPGGRLAFIVPGPTPIFVETDETFSKHLGKEAAGFIRAVFSLNDHSEINDMIKDTGFKDVSVRSEKKDLHLPPPQDFLWQYMTSTPLSSFIEKMDKETYATMESEVVEKWQPFVQNNSLVLKHDTIIAIANK